VNKIIQELPEMKLVGISVRTNNNCELDPTTSKIGITMQRFFAQNINNKISNPIDSDRILAVYTNYESDFMGDYTYFIGREVTSFEGLNNGLEPLTIPHQVYAKFTSEVGKIPDVVIDMWKQIWQMRAVNLGAERAYVADFEDYDKRSADPLNAILDIYIGIKK
jgi:predicted transcriptional regulator YdeE